MKYNTIFFDLDDTLIDTYANSIEALEEVYIKYGISRYISNPVEFRTKYHDINNRLWDHYEHGRINKEELKKERFFLTLKDSMEIDQLTAIEINNHFMELVSSKNNIIEGAIDILEYLYPRYELNILSNGFSEIQDRKMKIAGIDKYFRHIILSDHIGKNKPHAQIFEHALSIANANKDNSIMIGDNIKTDIKGAKQSGIDQIWFNPKGDTDVSQLYPTFEIRALSELKTIL